VIGLGLRLEYHPGRRNEGFAERSHSQRDETRCSPFPEENAEGGGQVHRAEVEGRRRRQKK
jgi:hypothetical protein